MSSKRGRQGIFHRIFALAEQLEPDRSRVFQWLCKTPIPALDSLTPIELVFAGRGEAVIGLLESECRTAGGEGFIPESASPESRAACSADAPPHQNSADPTNSRAPP